MKSLAQRAWIYFRKFHNLIGNEIYERFFLGLADEFLTIEHRKKIFVWVNFKQIQCPFLSPEHSILTDVKINQNGFKGSGQDISALEGSDS